jgi:prepilin signal peptidase PulO-like enzyme (type II secretory pathway)
VIDIGLDLTGFPGFIFSALIGLCLGSFATALTYRIPRGQSWIVSKGRAEHSACPSCHHSLPWFDLFPLLSWISLQGRCRYCRATIGWQYPGIEVAALLACLCIYGVFGLTLTGVIVMLAVPFLVSMVAIDLEHMILPDQINLILGVLGTVYILSSVGIAGIAWAVLAAVVYAALSYATAWAMTKILKKDAMGLGDVKFFAVAGLWLGLPMLPAFLMFSGLIGIGLGLMWKILWKKERFPFGPALILSFFACLLLMPQIMGFFY